MPLEFLTGAQVAGYGRFDGVPSRADLERFGVLDGVDRQVIIAAGFGLLLTSGVYWSLPSRFIS